MSENDASIVAIVDDDDSMRRSLKNLFDSVGLRAEAFASASAFLQSIHQEHIGCLVLDLRMPGMDGIALLEHLSDTGSRVIPAVILTAHGDDEARERSVQAGARAFLSKPVNSHALLAAVKAALNQGERLPDDANTGPRESSP